MNRKNTKGYCLHKTSKKWMAYIEKKGNRINLGLFTKENDARKARKKIFWRIC